MVKIFISHASADSGFVDEFVDDIIRLGCGVPESDLFYSSGAGTSVPPGSNLNSYVHTKVNEAGIVVAIISPAFRASAFCIAELGAAWSRAGTLIPLLVPELTHNSLDGVLDGIMVAKIDKESDLDQVHFQISKLLSSPTGAPTWNAARKKWLLKVVRLASALPSPNTLTASETAKLKQDLTDTTGALEASEAQHAKLKRQYERLKAARLDEIAETLLPEEDRQKLDELIRLAKVALGDLGSVMSGFLWHQRRYDFVQWPDDEISQRQAEQALNDGLLKEGDDEGRYEINFEHPRVEAAEEAVSAVQEFLKRGGDDLKKKFKDDGILADLKYEETWNKLFG